MNGTVKVEVHYISIIMHNVQVLVGHDLEWNIPPFASVPVISLPGIYMLARNHFVGKLFE